jgi:repressor LexA
VLRQPFATGTRWRSRVKDLTNRQREVLAFIRSFADRHGVPPTVREIGERFRFTARAAFDHLRALERKGMLQRRVSAKRVSRTLVPLDRGGPRRATPTEIPIMGRIAAGNPRLAVESRESGIPVSAEWFARKGEAVFALQVRGDSMIEAHIMDGDWVVVRRQESAEPGEIVAVMLGEDATVKRFERAGGRVILRPEHPTMTPIVVDPGQADVRILGKVVGVVRGLR